MKNTIRRRIAEIEKQYEAVTGTPLARDYPNAWHYVNPQPGWLYERWLELQMMLDW